MPEIFADRLVDAVRRKGSPICVGMDPMVDAFPPRILERFPDATRDPDAAVDAIFEFALPVLKAIAPVAPVVKFQSAYFERFLWEGVEAYYSLIAEARALGLLIIGDVKRSDIGSTCTAYAAAHLDPDVTPDEGVETPDAITVNPMLGIDTLEPFVKAARDADKGLFVLVRTSNPGSAVLQDARLADGRTWSELLADELAPVAASLVGSSGYSSIGAVVGATQPQTMQSLRTRLPKSIFLLPGYGAQGATAEMTRTAFDSSGQGALVSASRSILYAHKDEKYARFAGNWIDAVRAAADDMAADLQKVLR